MDSFWKHVSVPSLTGIRVAIGHSFDTRLV
jgi:hypothetical protein